MGEEAGLVPCLCRTELTWNGHEHGVDDHGEVTRVPPTGSHSASGAPPVRAAALMETASVTDPPLAAGDERSHLLKLDQRNPAWIKLGFLKIFFPLLLAVFFSGERDTAYYDLCK